MAVALRHENGLTLGSSRNGEVGDDTPPIFDDSHPIASGNATPPLC